MKKNNTQYLVWIWGGAILAIVGMIAMASRSKNMANRQRMPAPAGITNQLVMPNQPGAEPPIGMNTGTLESTYNQIASLMNSITMSIYGTVPGQTQVQLLGAGTVIGQQMVLTNLHIVQNNINLFVTDGGPQSRQYPVNRFRCDVVNDLVLLQVTNNVSFPVVGMIGNSTFVDAGDIVFAAGNAFGNGNLLTPGMIIDNNYSYVVNGQQFSNKFRTNINIYPGSCGGPLVNIKGEIIGVNNSMGYTANNYMGIGYATPVNQALGLLNSSGPVQGPADPFVPAAFNNGNPYALA